MAAKHRLTFASMWAFEEIGVQEIEEKFQEAYPQFECHCEYSNAEDVLVIKGKLEGQTSQAVALVSTFIENQMNKDLLDIPRVRLLDIPSMLQDHTPVMAKPERDEQGALLAMEDDSEEVAPHPITRTTKFWLSAAGGIGCFSSGNFSELLAEVANCTGTEIAIIDELSGVQVSGTRASDVDDAMSKLTRIEKPLSCLSSPQIMNAGVVPTEAGVQLSMQNFSDMNPVAQRRILMDPNMNSLTVYGQMFVTVLHNFDEGKQIFTLPEHLLNPLRCSNETGRSRTWSDFTFPELGTGTKFLAMESISENNSTNFQRGATGPSLHPFLSPEKARQVKDWVVERASLEALETEVEDKADSSSSITPPSVPLQQSTPPSTAGPAMNKPPGLKVRRAVTSGQNPRPPATPERRSATTEQGNPLTKTNDDVTTPRKHWKMNYGVELSNANGEDSINIAKVSKLEKVPELPKDFMSLNTVPVEGRTLLPVSFDATKYGPNKPSVQPTSSIQNSSKFKRSNPKMPILLQGKTQRENELIEIVTVTSGAQNNIQPTLSFDQPALVPKKLSSTSTPKRKPRDVNDRPDHDVNTSFPGLAGLQFEATENKCSSYSDESSRTRSSENDIRLCGEDRLWLVQRLYRKRQVDTGSTHNPDNHTSRMSRIIAEKELARLERSISNEGEKHVDEIRTREFHRTMNQKTSMPGNRKKGKAETKAKRQATLEDAWGIANSAGNKIKNASTKKENAPIRDNGCASASDKDKGKGPQADASINVHIKQVFETMKLTLEAAEAFPGELSLEVQIGLVFVPLLPKTCGDGLMSPNEWSRIFQPRSGLSAPSTRFVSRLTTSGSDVDHIVDLKTSKAEGKRRIFEQDYSEYGVSYEYHCETKAGKPLVIIINEQGKFSIQNPSAILGATNIHFPERVWDARTVLSGRMAYRPGTHPEFEEAAHYLADNLWVQPDKSLIRLFTCLPKGNGIFIDKVLMKRWTRHRHIRSDDNLASKKATLKDRNTTAAGSEFDGDQDIFLQVTEVQDLLVGTSDSMNDQPVRARCAPPLEMIHKGKQWYEVSLISPIIDAILKTNANLEVGERTDDWRSTDLLGKDVCILHDQAPCYLSSVGPVASAIGTAGLGDLLRLSKTVVEKIDGIGYWNNTLPPETSREVIPRPPNQPPPSACAGLPPKMEITGLSFAAFCNHAQLSEAFQLAPGNSSNKPITSSVAEPQPKTENKGLEFDEIESVKEVESVGAKNSQSPRTDFASAMDQFERDYW